MPNYLLRISVGLFFTLIPLFTTFAQITQVGAVTNASGANVQTLTVNKPTGAVIGDVLIMTVIKHVTGNTDDSWVNDNAGSAWTTLVSGGLGGDNNYRLTVLYKVISVDWEPTSYTVVPTAGWSPNATYMQVSLMAYRGINIANPINTFSALATTAATTGTTITPASITPTVNNSLLLMLSGSYRNAAGTRTFSAWTTATAGNLTEILDVAGADRTRLGAASLSLSGTSATGSGTITLSGNGTYRGAVLMALAPASIATGSITGSPFCQGASVTVPFTTTGVHTSGNVFTAQLSDAAGSFSSPTTIGTLSGTTSGSISAVLPFGLSAGTSYRIRVISSAPSITGSDNGSNLTISASVSAPTVTGAYLCIGGSTAVTLSASGASTGDVYKWYSAASGGTLLKTSSNNSDNTYTTPSLSSTTSYWVSIQNASGCESARVQVDATLPSAYGGSQTLAGTDSWISHIYDGISLGTYYGTTTQTETFDQNFAGGATCFPFIAGANPLSIYTETFSVSSRMNSTKRGIYTVSMGGDDGVRLYVDNNLVYNRWIDQAYTQNDNVLISLTGSSQLRYEFYENGGENRYTFQNLTKIFDNTLSANLTQSVYQGQTGAAIGGDVFGTFPTGITGTGYQWYYSTTPGGARTAISGATGATFSPNTSVAPFNVVGTYYIYRTASITSTNNYNPASYVATLESNAATLQVVTPPTITASTTSLTGFTYLVNNGPSTEQSFTVAGANLLSNITVTPPTDYEISTTSGSGFQSTPITLTQSGGSVASTTIYVRLKAGLNSGTYNAENIQLTADLATTRTVACSGSVTLPTYCTMSGNMTYNTSITSVVFNTISQTSAKPSGYSDYTSVSTNLILGLTNNLSVSINTGGTGSCYVRAWLDLNANGSFSDAGESFDLGYATTTSNSLTNLSPKSITIPTTSIIGQTRLRVAVLYNAYPTLCSTNFDGEVEDYTINIVAPTLTTGTLSASSYVPNQSVSVPFTVTGAFRAGNTFTAQLSDASGSFASPVTIGTLSGTGSGTITATIPAGAVAGSGYRIRVVASNPSVIAADNGTNITILGPGIYVTPVSLSGFTYKQTVGPSTVQSFSVGGTQLSENIFLEMKNGNFEISTSNSPFSGLSAFSLPTQSQSVATTNIYVRLKAGLTQGTYTDTVYVTSAGYATKVVSLTGTVTAPGVLVATPTALSFNSYSFGAGPSNTLSFSLSASNITNSVVVTPPTDFEISSDGTTFQSTAITYTTGQMATARTVYARMKSGGSVGVHNSNIQITSVGALPINVACTGSVNATAAILNSTSYLGAFIYTAGSGPSAIQAFELKVNDLSAGSTVTVTPPASGNYAISLTRNSADFQTSAISFTNQSGNFTDSIYVRLVAGKAVGTYGPEGVILTASGAVTKSVACLGKVVAINTPTLYASETSVNGLGYQAANSIFPVGIKNNGPSNAQKFVLTGSALTNPVTITAPTGFEVSFSKNSGFATSITKSASGVLLPNDVYVRIVSGLTSGVKTGNITVTSTGASSLTIPINSAQVYASPLVEASGGGDYCTGTTVNLTSTGGSELANRFWEGPNGYYSSNPNISFTNATSAINGDYVVTANVTVGGNLVYNGNFEQGNVGFGSAYGYPATPFNTNSLVPEGLYAITTTGSTVHYNFNSVADYSNPGTLQMIINGNTNAGAVVWSQNVSVLPDADYQFSYWLQTVIKGTDGAPSKLQLYINGIAAGPIYTANPSSGNWTQYVYNTNSGSASSLNLELINQTIIAGGNDFALDDIELHQVLYAKDTATVAVGSALPVSVALVASQNPVNAGVPVTYTATPTNGGTTPAYAWSVTSALGVTTNYPAVTGATFTYTPTDGDVVRCVLTSSLNCVTGNPATATVTMIVNAVVNPNYWWGFQSTDWANPSNWTDNRVPAAGEDVTYATVANNGVAAYRDLWVDGSRVVGSVINATNRKLVIPAGKQLVVNNNIEFTNKSDSLIVIKASATLPNGTLIFNNAQNNPVYATVEMYSRASWNLSMPVNHKYNWQFFGIPVSTLTATPTFVGAYVRQLLEHKDSISNHWESLNDASVMVPFRGYEVVQKNPKTYSFKGRINNVNYASGQLVKTTTGNPLYPGQHLLANSYTSAIKVKNIEFGTDMEQTVYIYNTGAFASWQGQAPTIDSLAFVPGQYNSVPKNQAGVGGLLTQIPSMSAFMVRIKNTVPASTANCYVNLTYASVVMRNNELQRAPSATNDSIAQQTLSTVNVYGENGADKLWIMTNGNYSDSYDNGFDGLKLEGTALNPQLYAYSNGLKLQINSVPDLNNMLLYFRAGQDNEYTIKFNHDDKLVEKYSRIFLHDLTENAVVDISLNGSEYRFSANSAAGTVARFRILAAQKLVESNKNNLSTLYVNNHKVYIQNLSDKSGKVYLYDITGRILGIQNINPYENIYFNTPNTQAYMVKRVIGDTTENSKICID